MTPNDNTHEPQPAISAEGAEPKCWPVGTYHDGDAMYEIAAPGGPRLALGSTPEEAWVNYRKAQPEGAELNRDWTTEQGEELRRILRSVPEESLSSFDSIEAWFRIEQLEVMLHKAVHPEYWTDAQPEGAESVALPLLEFTPEERDSIYSAESENYYTLKCRERQLRSQIAANARLGAERDEIKAQRDEAIAAVRELDPAWEAQWKRATKAEAQLAAAQVEIARMKGEA